MNCRSNLRNILRVAGGSDGHAIKVSIPRVTARANNAKGDLGLYDRYEESCSTDVIPRMVLEYHPFQK